MLNHVGRVALLLAHAAPELWYEQADVVVDLAPADVAGRAREARVAGEYHAHQSRVQVRRESERIEGALGESAFGAGSRGGRRLPRETADELHEELWEILEVYGVEDSKGPDRRAVLQCVWWIVPAAREHSVDREVCRLAPWDVAPQPRRHLCHPTLPRLTEVSPDLQIPGVCRWLAIDDPEVVGAHNVLAPVFLLCCCGQAPLHGLREFVECHGLLGHQCRLLYSQRLEVRHEGAVLSHILFALCVATSDDGIIRALEKAQLTILQHFHCRVGDFHIQVLESIPGHYDGRADIIFCLNLLCWHKVVAKLELSLQMSGCHTDAEILRRHLLTIHMHAVRLGTIHHLCRDMGLPVLAPFWLVEVLDEEDKAADVPRNGLQPIIVVRAMVKRGREHLYD
mmetsp:Transcript_39356/g.94272  ORF Transcript_39356/g.94272 Transcript_39356/m.94272 type:complete len:397 (-) Transcript_39356:1123-2313(-)